MHTNVHCSTVYNSKDLEPTQMPIDDRLDWKMWHIYTMEYYAAIKNDEFMSFVRTWMNLENIILSKLTQEQKMKYHMFTHRWVMNNENTWTQGGEHYTLGSIGGNRGGTATGELGRDSMGRNARCG